MPEDEVDRLAKAAAEAGLPFQPVVEVNAVTGEKRLLRAPILPPELQNLIDGIEDDG